MLAAIYVPASAFEVSAAYNILDATAAIHLGLEGLPVNQVYHPYVNVGTPNLTNAACRCSILLPIKWHPQLSRDHPYSITLKVFYDIFLSPLQAVVGHLYINVKNWWRHATTCAVMAGARACSGLQVATTEALPPALHASHDGWAQEQVEHILKPLQAGVPSLSSGAFKAGMQLLWMDLAAQHTAREARELAQHVDQEAWEDRCNAPQIFEGRFGTTKLKEVLQLLGKNSANDLPKLLQDLGHNKKKSDDTLMIQMVINNCAMSLASTANDYTKPQLSTHIIDLF